MGSAAAGRRDIPGASGLSVRTSPSGGSFGAATTLSATAGPTALVIDPGHAVLITSGAVFTEPVS